MRQDCGGVLPLGGEPTVKTTLAGLPEPTTIVPPADGAREKEKERERELAAASRVHCSPDHGTTDCSSKPSLP